MKKLYEVLALEPDLMAKAKTVGKTVVKTFANGEYFVKRSLSYRSLIDGQPEIQSKDTEMAYQVKDLLAEVRDSYGAYIDASLTKEATNVNTEGTLIVGGEEFAKLPATALLNLEARLAEIREILAEIPTIDPSGKWEYDKSTELLKAGPFARLSTRKVKKTHVAYPHTPEHPAQTETYNEDVPDYEISETIWNSKLTIAEKQRLLRHTDTLIQETKAARLRANDHIIAEVNLAEKLFNYILS